MNRHLSFMAAVLLLVSSQMVFATDNTRRFAFEAVVDSEDSATIRIPMGVAAGSDTELAVVDAHENRLIIFQFTGTEWIEKTKISLAGPPRAIGHDGNRYLVSMREGRGLIAVEGERHTLRPIFPPDGVVPGDVAGIPDGGFLVHDTAGDQVLKLDRSGKVEASWKVEAGIVGLATARSGGFYTSIPVPGEIVRYDARGELAGRWPVPPAAPVPAWPVALVQIDGDLVTLDRHSHRILSFDSKGQLVGTGARRGWEPGLLLFPSAVAAFPDGRIIVADQMNGRVQIYRKIEVDPVQ